MNARSGASEIHYNPGARPVFKERGEPRTHRFVEIWERVHVACARPVVPVLALLGQLCTVNGTGLGKKTPGGAGTRARDRYTRKM